MRQHETAMSSQIITSNKNKHNESEHTETKPHLFVVLLRFMVTVSVTFTRYIHIGIRCCYQLNQAPKYLTTLKIFFIEKDDQNHVCVVNEMNESGQRIDPILDA